MEQDGVIAAGQARPGRPLSRLLSHRLHRFPSLPRYLSWNMLLALQARCSRGKRYIATYPLCHGKHNLGHSLRLIIFSDASRADPLVYCYCTLTTIALTPIGTKKMPSTQSNLVGDLFTRLNKHLGTEDLDVDLYRIIQEEHSSVATEPTAVSYEEVQCPGTVRPAIWCRPESASLAHVIIYLHGGGFISGSPSSHRKLAAHLAKRARCTSLVLDYRRSPEHGFPAQIDDVVAVYQWLLEKQGFSANRIALAGDSAGGNLTVSSSLAIKNLGLNVPAAIAAFSPWFDMRLTGESWKRNAETDLLVVPQAMQSVVTPYVGKYALDTPGLDLLNTDLGGLPPMYLSSGTAEVLEDDAVLLAENATRCGVEVCLVRAEGMQHIWVLMAGNAQEADKTLEEAATFIRSKMAD